MTRRITTIKVCDWPAWYPGARRIGRNLDFYLLCLDKAGDRFEAETRLLDALDDRSLSDDAYHQVRLHFDDIVKGMPS